MLALIAEGLTNREICDRLSLSMPTVKTHVGNLNRQDRRPGPRSARPVRPPDRVRHGLKPPALWNTPVAEIWK
ncbi:LuxR C-terminal-related transcriptional regulator [Nonomuraea candida]|uniref:LuxR C-terminal-related transcriptional regulator n=1 Tax=Nonomuraea candida TaxID=359159 RepID=UPI003F6E3FCA